MNAVQKLEVVMRKNGHLREEEMLDVELIKGNGCIRSLMVNLDQLSSILEGAVEVDWISSLPSLSVLYSYFNQKGRIVFRFKKQTFRGAATEAKQFLTDILKSNRAWWVKKQIWIPATWALEIYRAYSTKSLVFKTREKIFVPIAA